jgi:hypothetical protein
MGSIPLPFIESSLDGMPPNHASVECPQKSIPGFYSRDQTSRETHVLWNPSPFSGTEAAILARFRWRVLVHLNLVPHDSHLLLIRKFHKMIQCGIVTCHLELSKPSRKIGEATLWKTRLFRRLHIHAPTWSRPPISVDLHIPTNPHKYCPKERWGYELWLRQLLVNSWFDEDEW